MSDVFTAQVRALQAMHAQAHAVSRNWGLWSMDWRDIGPVEVVTPGYNKDFRAGPEYADDPVEASLAPAEKADPIDSQPYDELAAKILDERIHGPGGMPEYIRRVYKLVYATRTVPEYQLARLSGCTEAAVLERLEGALLFVRRFV